MNKLNLIINIVGVCIDTIILYYYIGSIFKICKVRRSAEILTYYIVMALLFVVAINYSDTFIILLIYFILILIVTMLYEGKLFLKIIISLIFLALFILFEVTVSMIIVALMGRNVDYIFNNIIYYMQVVLVSKLLVFIVVKTFEYRMTADYALISQKIQMPLVLIPITSILVIYIVTNKVFLTTGKYNISLIILTASLLIILNICIFYLFEKQLKQEEEKIKLEFLKEQLKNQKVHFEELRNNQIRINKAVHDTKNQLLAVLGYVENNQNQKAIETINLLCHNILGKANLVNTGNVAVDSLLNAKLNMIRKLDIDLETYFLLEPNLKVDEIDLCVVLGNILDNAIEACQKISTEKERKIYLKIAQVEEHVLIEICNSISHKVIYKNGKIITKKKDKLFHGYGLKNVEDVVEKYNGNITYEQEENIFIVRILLQSLVSKPILQK